MTLLRASQVEVTAADRMFGYSRARAVVLALVLTGSRSPVCTSGISSLPV
jgi:hypothetical protein